MVIQHLYPASPIPFSPLISCKKEEGEENSMESLPFCYPQHIAQATHESAFVSANILFSSIWITHTIHLQV